MILVTGAKGQLGFDVCRELERNRKSFVSTDIDTLDITNEESVRAFFSEHTIDCVIHCAAYTAVDKAETEQEKCYDVNQNGTLYLARSAKLANAKFLYVSTDYVFFNNGEETPHEVDDAKAPICVYGKSKLAGEKAVLELCEKHFIIRTSWVFGEKNTNFIATMLRLAESRDEVSVVCDQIGSPTYSKHLARLICNIASGEKYGVYHATNEGFCSWCELAKFAYSVKNIKTKVIPILTSEYKTNAVRPLNSRLSKASLDNAGFNRLPKWEDAVREYLNNI